MRVAVLGAGGTIAPAIVRDLADSEEIEAMLLLDIDGEKARATAEMHGGGKASAAEIDASQAGSLAQALDGCDAVLNSASYRLNIDAMAACLAAGSHYLDLGGLYWVTRQQLEIGPQFEDAGLLAVLGIGSSPGKTNLLAARAVEQLGLGGTVDSLHVSAGGRDLDPPAGETFPYALRTLLDEVTMAPVVIREGEPVELEPLTDGGEVDFGDPIGVASAVNTIHSEMLTFPSSFGCHEASFRLSLPPAVEARLRELAGAGDDEITRVFAASSPPSPQTVSVHLVEASGGGRSIRARSVTPPHEGWGLGGGIVSTATPIAAAARLLARGEVSARGVHPPELCLDPEAMFAELETRGVRFEIEETEAEEVQTA